MPRVIGMSSENCNCPVELFGRHQPRHRVRHRHWPKRQQQTGALACCAGPSVGRAHSKNQVLRTLIAPRAEPGGKDLGAHLLSPAVKQNSDGRRSALLLVEPCEERIFFLETLGLATRESGTALQIRLYEGLQFIS